MMGPNARRLIAIKMARDAIPSGEGFEAGLRFLSSKESIVAGAKAATEWVQAAIQVVRLAQDPNPFKTADDETIAAEILRKLEEKEAARRKARHERYVQADRDDTEG